MSTIPPVEYVSSPVAARMLGYRDARSAIRLAELGEVAAHRSPGGHWRFDKASVEAFRVRMTTKAS